METQKIVNFSNEFISDYQTLIRDGWTDSGKVSSTFKHLDKRNMVRTMEVALAEQQKTNKLHQEKINKMTPAQRRMRNERFVLRNRGIDV